MGFIEKYGWSTLITSVLVYSSQGFKSLASAAKTLYFKNKFGFDPAELTILTTVTVIAWYMKPVFGLISDSIPLFGYKRKSYMIFSSILGFSSYTLILVSNHSGFSIACLAFGELSTVISDVICDGYLVEKSRVDPIHGANDLQRVCWSSLFITSIIGLVIGGWAADFINPAYLVSFLAICPLLVLFVSFIIDEKKVENIEGLRSSCKSIWKNLKVLWKSFTEKDNLRVIVFILCWGSFNVYFSAIFVYFLYDIVGVMPSTLTLIEACGSVAALLGTLTSGMFWNLTIYHKLIIGRILYNSTTLLDLAVVTKYYESLGLPIYPFLYGSTTVGSAINMFFNQMPILIIFTKVTPHDIEATFYSAMSSVFNFSSAISEIIAGIIMYSTSINSPYSESIWVLFVISMGLGFFSLVFVEILPGNIKSEKKYETSEYHDIEMPLIHNKN